MSKKVSGESLRNEWQVIYTRIFQFDKYWLDEVEETDYFSHLTKKTTAIYFMLDIP